VLTISRPDEPSGCDPLLLGHGQVAIFQHLQGQGGLASGRGLGRRHGLRRYRLNRPRRRRATTLFYLASRNAFFFVLDFHDQIFPRSRMLTLMAIAVVARPVLAVAAAATVSEKAKEGAFGQAKLLAGVGVYPLIDPFRFRGGYADTPMRAAAVAAASALTTGLTTSLDNDHIIGQGRAGHGPSAQGENARGEGQKLPGHMNNLL